MKIEINQYIKYGLIIILLILSFFIIKPYIKSIVFSLIIAYMFFPVQNWLKQKLKNDSVSAGIITILAFCIFVIPLLFLANTLINEASHIYVNTEIGSINSLLEERLNLTIGINTQEYLNSFTKTATAFILTKVSEFIFSIPNLLLNFFIMFFVLFFAIRDGKNVLTKAKDLIPLEEKYKERLEKKITSNIQSLFYGTIALASIETIVAMIGFYFLGVEAPVLWGFVVGLTAIIPGIGAAFVWVPMTIFSLLQGNVTIGILRALFGLIILSIILDTFLRAKILGIKGEIHPLIIVIGVLGGVSTFGFIGIFIGPLILSLLELTLEIYLEIRHETKS